jgi:RimJ/RimL family protein N-acetyltransferase
LEVSDVPVVAEMLATAGKDYQKFYTPFAFDEQSLRAMLQAAKEDLYTGLWYDNILVGFFMLRGWDAGFSIPSYGVYIKETYAGKGLLKLTLHLAASLCRLKGIPRLMLKVHPENMVAKAAYEKFGFIPTGLDPKNNNVIYHYDVL